MAQRCDGIRKTMKYEIRQPFVLQISGSHGEFDSIAIAPSG